MKIKHLFENLQGVKKFSKMTWEQFQQYLSEQGIHLIGSGLFGKVFYKEGWNYVIKVFEKDDPYLEFVNYCMHRPNKHLPKFFANPRHLPQFLLRQQSNINTITIVKVEKLNKLDKNVSLFLKRNIKNLADHFKNKPKEPVTVIDNNEQKQFHNVFEVFVEYRKYQLQSLLTVYNNLDELTHSEMRNDMHSGNMMQRDDGTIVIIDAFSIPICLSNDYSTIFNLIPKNATDLVSGVQKPNIN